MSSVGLDLPAPVAVDDTLLAELAGFVTPGHAPATTFTVDLTDGDDHLERARSLLATATARAATLGSAVAQELVRRDRGRIVDLLGGGVLDDLVTGPARGLSVFAAGSAYWRVMLLAGPVPDGVHLQPTLHLAALVDLAAEAGGVTIIAIDADGGRLLRPQGGHLVPAGELAVRDGGRAGTGRRAAIAHAISQTVEATDGRPWIALAGDRVWAGVAEHLAPEATAALFDRVDGDGAGSDPEVEAATAAAVATAAKRAEEAGIDRWREEAGRGERAATGWDATLAAISDGRVQVLWLAPGRRAVAYCCHRCGRLAAEPGRCAVDGTPLRRYEDGADQAIRATYAQGGSVRPVRFARDLDPVGGIGALLRF